MKSIKEWKEGLTPAERIEQVTQQKLTLETSLSENLSKCNPQDLSPLFTKLPKEIRDIILVYATEQYEDLTDRPYDCNTFHYRPGYRGPHRTDTNILLTCRRLWLEAHALPMRQWTLTCWFEPMRGPAKHACLKAPPEFVTKLNRENFRTLQWFVQMHVLKDMFWDYSDLRGGGDNLMKRLRPKVFRLTVRHTDWNRWEDPLPLQLPTDWLQRALDHADLDTLQKFQVELETLEVYKDQIDNIIQDLSHIEGKRKALAEGDGTSAAQLKCTGGADIRIWHWTGPTDVGGKIEKAHEGMNQLDYRVAVLTWRSVPAVLFPEDPKAAEQGAKQAAHDSIHAIRARRERLSGSRQSAYDMVPRRAWQSRQKEWEGMQFPFANYLLRWQARFISDRTEQAMHSSFTRLMADVEIKNLQERWQAQNSLLKFED